MADEPAAPSEPEAAPPEAAAEVAPAAEPPKDDAEHPKEAAEGEFDAGKTTSGEQLIKSTSMQITGGHSQAALTTMEEAVEGKREKLAKAAIEVVGEVIDVRRASLIEGGVGGLKVARFMNTYKLESDNPFNIEKVDRIIKEVMDEAFEIFEAFKYVELEEGEEPKQRKYDAQECADQAKWAANEIRGRVKNMEFDRFKILVLVTIGEKHNQDYLCCCRFLWDCEKDNYCRYIIENPLLFGVALCFGLYYE